MGRGANRHAVGRDGSLGRTLAGCAPRRFARAAQARAGGKLRMSLLADVPRRVRFAALAGVAGVLGAAVALGFGPFVRARVARAAERRGLSVQIGRVGLGPGAVWLK